MVFRNSLNFVLSTVLICAVLKFVPYSYDIFLMVLSGVGVMKLAEWLMTITRKYFLYKTVSPKNKTVLITGCDTGFGNALARRMDKLGYSVLATCLDAEGEGARKLSQDCSKRLTVLPMNVTDEQSIQNVKLFIQKNLGKNALWAIVNNAGIVQCGQVEWTSVEDFQNICNVNTFGVLRVTKAFLPFIKQAKGRIVNVSSIGGRCTSAGIVPYCVSKSAVNSLTTGLQIEIQKFGVKCINVEPFVYATPINETQALFASANRTWNAAPADIKEEYGEDYFEAFKIYLQRSFSLFLNPNVYEVIDCLEDAITSECPLPLYAPGSFLHRVVFLCLYHALPLGMAEFIISFTLENSGKFLSFRRKIKNN